MIEIFTHCPERKFGFKINAVSKIFHESINPKSSSDSLQHPINIDAGLKKLSLILRVTFVDRKIDFYKHFHLQEFKFVFDCYIEHGVVNAIIENVKFYTRDFLVHIQASSLEHQYGVLELNSEIL